MQGPGWWARMRTLPLMLVCVSLERHGLVLEPSVILNLVHGAAGQGPEDTFCQGGLPDPGLDVDVFRPIGNHVSDLIQPSPGIKQGSCLTCFFA